MRIPFFSLARQWKNLKPSLELAIKHILEQQQFIGGPTITLFEKKLAQFVGASHAITCNSGTDALWLALKTLDLEAHSLVLTTPFSFIASSSEIVAHGGIPVFIDIDKDTYNICPKQLKKWLETHVVMNGKIATHKKTGLPVVGIVAVNVFGQTADYAELHKIAQEWNLWTVEDAAQSIGAKYLDQQSGTLGTISCFSFYPTKNLGACGDGGALTTNNPELAERLYRLRNHGRKSHYHYAEHGINSRLDCVQATILQEKLKVLPELTQRRRHIAACYSQQLAHVPFIQIPKDTTGSHVFHQYSVKVVDVSGTIYRDTLIQHLSHHQIDTRIFYPQGLYQIDFLVKDQRFATTCPVTEMVTKTIISLPIWPELTDEEVMYICDCIKCMPIAQTKEKISQVRYS
jgi:dTDP-4-amino-4,6-dideoxygalactose transaminase